MPRGRPRLSNPLAGKLNIRHTPDQRAGWQRAADSDRRRLSDWIRLALDAAATGTPVQDDP